MHNDLLIAILAAGASRRLGQPKQLVTIDGESLLRRQCRIAIESKVAPVAVVCGCHAESCVAQVADLPVSIRRNEQWCEGIASSIREATAAAIERNCEALLILHVDQYRITAEDLRVLRTAWIGSIASRIIRSRGGDYVGPPVVFPAGVFSQLMQLRGDEGARSVLWSLGPHGVIDVHLPNAIYDLDLPEQLEMAYQQAS